MSETNPHNQGTSVTFQKLAGVLTRGQVLKVVTKLTLRVTSCTRKSKRTPVPSSFTKNRTKTCQSNRLKGMSRASSQQYLRHRGTCVKGRQALPWKWVDLWAARMFIGGSNNFPPSWQNSDLPRTAPCSAANTQGRSRRPFCMPVGRSARPCGLWVSSHVSAVNW